MKVEIKETVSGDAVDLVEKALAPGGTVTERRIFFSEVRVPPEAPLVLAARGLILRSRRGPGGGDVTLKLRGPDGCLDTDQWDRRTRDHSGAKLEGDWAGGVRLLSASLDHDLDPDHGGDLDPETAAAVTGSLSDEQAALAREWMIPLGTLDVLGPVASRKWSATLPGPGLECDVEIWECDELRFLEVSTRVKADRAEATRRDLHDGLVGLGLPESAFTGATKTEAVLRRLMRDDGDA
jgi:hypothetical protein